MDQASRKIPLLNLTCYISINSMGLQFDRLERKKATWIKAWIVYLCYWTNLVWFILWFSFSGQLVVGAKSRGGGQMANFCRDENYASHVSMWAESTGKWIVWNWKIEHSYHLIFSLSPFVHPSNTLNFLTRFYFPITVPIYHPTACFTCPLSPLSLLPYLLPSISFPLTPMSLYPAPTISQYWHSFTLLCSSKTGCQPER